MSLSPSLLLAILHWPDLFFLKSCCRPWFKITVLRDKFNLPPFLSPALSLSHIHTFLFLFLLQLIVPENIWLFFLHLGYLLSSFRPANCKRYHELVSCLLFFAICSLYSLICSASLPLAARPLIQLSNQAQQSHDYNWVSSLKFP